MYLATFSLHGRARLGVKQGDFIVGLDDCCINLSAVPGEYAPLFTSLHTFLKGGSVAMASSKAIMAHVAELEAGSNAQEKLSLARCRFPLDEVTLEAPISNPQKIIAIGLNYRDHCEEHGAKAPDRPIIFAKFPSAIIGPEAAITWPPEITSEVDYEAELAVVIGKSTRKVAEAEAMDYVAGYTIANDVSARDLQFSDGQWVRGKSLDTFCPLGPYLVTKDEVLNPHNLDICCRLNGILMQQSNTSNLIFQIPKLVSFASWAFTLLPGDIICTGTPAGVGVYREPPVFLKRGDVVEVEIEKLGRLQNPVR